MDVKVLKVTEQTLESTTQRLSKAMRIVAVNRIPKPSDDLTTPLVGKYYVFKKYCLIEDFALNCSTFRIFIITLRNLLP